MYCHNCGTKLPEDSAFCPNCGQAVPGSGNSSATPMSKLSSRTAERIQAMKVAYMIQSGSQIVSVIALLISYSNHKYDVKNAAYYSDAAATEALLGVMAGLIGCVLISVIGVVVAGACLRGVFKSKAQITYILAVYARKTQATTDISNELTDVEPFAARWKPARKAIAIIADIAILVIMLLFLYHSMP